ncbi:hypothetical protein ACTNDG_07335 [Clostridium sp. HCP1S3_B4]|uniref:hypothetical protein n=1 Tax=unclassified Clostridium TaxID=2614128 RepID=UPI003F89BD82
MDMYNINAKDIKEILETKKIEKDGEIFFLLNYEELDKLEKMLDEYNSLKQLVISLKRQNMILRDGIKRINDIVSFKKNK